MAADLIYKDGFTKPIVACLAECNARPDTRFGHAGAIISCGIGSAERMRKGY